MSQNQSQNQSSWEQNSTSIICLDEGNLNKKMNMWKELLSSQQTFFKCRKKLQQVPSFLREKAAEWHSTVFLHKKALLIASSKENLSKSSIETVWFLLPVWQNQSLQKWNKSSKMPHPTQKSNTLCLLLQDKESQRNVFWVEGQSKSKKKWARSTGTTIMRNSTKSRTEWSLWAFVGESNPKLLLIVRRTHFNLD